MTHISTLFPPQGPSCEWFAYCNIQRKTYVARIGELRQLCLSSKEPDGKALPQRPLSDESRSPRAFSSWSDMEEEEDEDAAVIGTATTTRIVNNPSCLSVPKESRSLTPSQIPPRRQSLLPSAFDEEVRFTTSSSPSRPYQGSESNSSKLEAHDESPPYHAPTSDGVPRVHSSLFPRNPSPP